MDCWGLGAGCCLALLLHSTLLGALIPQAYERERGGSGRKGDGSTEGGKKKEGCDQYCDYDDFTFRYRPVARIFLKMGYVDV